MKPIEFDMCTDMGFPGIVREDSPVGEHYRGEVEAQFDKRFLAGELGHSVDDPGGVHYFIVRHGDITAKVGEPEFSGPAGQEDNPEMWETLVQYVRKGKVIPALFGESMSGVRDYKEFEDGFYLVRFRITDTVPGKLSEADMKAADSTAIHDEIDEGLEDAVNILLRKCDHSGIGTGVTQSDVLAKYHGAQWFEEMNQWRTIVTYEKWARIDPSPFRYNF